MTGKSDMDSSLDEQDEQSLQLLELKDAFVSALTANGVLGKIKAQLRASAVSLLRGDPTLAEAAVGRTTAPDHHSLESGVVLLLIHQFLLQHNMTATAGVFEAEGAVREVSRAARDVVERRFAGRTEEPAGATVLEEPVLTTLVRDALLAGEGEVIVTRAHSSASLASTFSGLPAGATRQAAQPNATASSSGNAAVETEGGEAQHAVKVAPGAAGGVDEGVGHMAEQERLEELAYTPAIAQALRQLEESFDFSDVEGPLEKSDEILYDRVDSV